MSSRRRDLKICVLDFIVNRVYPEDVVVVFRAGAFCFTAHHFLGEAQSLLAGTLDLERHLNGDPAVLQ